MPREQAKRRLVSNIPESNQAVRIFIVSQGATVRRKCDSERTDKRIVSRQVSDLAPRGYPFWIACATALLLSAGLISFSIARALGRREDRDFARLRELRARLGLDA